MLVEIGPATVMGWRKAPRLIVDPAPAPRRHPPPMAVAVGRPIRGQRVRDPDLAVFAIGPPAARGIERCKAGHRRGHVIGRGKTALVDDSGAAPNGKFVGGGR